MSNELTFVNVTGEPGREQAFWPTMVLPRASIQREIERLADLTRPGDGRRASAINHPMNNGPVPCLAPGIDVHVEVLKPGEQTAPLMRSSTRVDMCIQGQGAVQIGKKQFNVEKFDVWNTPSMEPYSYRNDGQELFVRLSYSNTPLLERLEIHYTDLQPQVPSNEKTYAEPADSKLHSARSASNPIPIGKEGADLRGYEWLVDIDVVKSQALLWPWKEVEPHMGNVYGMDVNYTGRHLYLLYNPSTERRMGTSHSFFATIAKLPPGKVDQPHRHSSAAINYIMWGKGRSAVNGQTVQWEEGDLHFSAPGWSVHNHASREQGCLVLTIQDHPLHIAMESLLWQETLKAPIHKLGASEGIETNLHQFVKAA